MTLFLPADIEHISRGEWRTYVPSRQLFFHGTSEADVKEATARGVEEATGDHDVQFFWHRR